LNVRGKAVIVGAAESDLGEVGPGFTPLDLIGQATERALADAGLEKRDVDGLFSASVYYQTPTLSAGEYLGIRPRYSDATMMGGSSFISHLLHATAALEAGLCEVALITYASTQLSEGGFRGVSDPPNPYETPYGPRYPVSMYALAASRHMHEYGTTRKQLAEVAVAAREWAKLNPKAFMRDDLTVEDVLASRMVSSPLSILDCCLVTDGGGALLVTSPERAKDLRKPPVYLLGAGDAHWHRNISQMPDLTVTAAADSGRRAYEMAGVGPQDVALAMLYDAFTINPILFLEDLGFCKKGEGGAFVEGGRIAPGGEIAVNTNGGGLSYNHPGMYGLLLLIEAVRQLRGECGERQVEGVDVALAHGNGGVLSSQGTAVLGTERVL
jgi:acetyl-CoA acetyltransferase